MRRLCHASQNSLVIIAFKYEVIRTRRGKVEHLDLGSHYINDGGNEVSYENCSDGQKTILDINFLSKVVTRMGLLVMDEFLKHLDAKNHENLH